MWKERSTAFPKIITLGPTATLGSLQTATLSTQTTAGFESSLLQLHATVQRNLPKGHVSACPLRGLPGSLRPSEDHSALPPHCGFTLHHTHHRRSHRRYDFQAWSLTTLSSVSPVGPSVLLHGLLTLFIRFSVDFVGLL